MSATCPFVRLRALTDPLLTDVHLDRGQEHLKELSALDHVSATVAVRSRARRPTVQIFSVTAGLTRIDDHGVREQAKAT